MKIKINTLFSILMALFFASCIEAKLSSIAWCAVGKPEKVGLMRGLLNYGIDNYFQSFPTAFKTQLFLNVLTRDIHNVGNSYEDIERAQKMAKNVADAHKVYDFHLEFLVSQFYAAKSPWKREIARKVLCEQLNQKYYFPSLIVSRSMWQRPKTYNHKKEKPHKFQ